MEFVYVERATGKVARRMGPLTLRKASKIERGASINLDHEGWFTRIVNEASAEVDHG